MERLTVYIGRDNSWDVTLLDEQAEPITGVYTGAESLTLRVAPGHGHAALDLPGSSATWRDPAAGVITLRIARADTAGLAAGGAYLWIDLTDGPDVLPAYEAWLAIEQGPGTATPHPVYCAMADIYAVAPWIDTTIAADPNLEADLGDQRGRARQRIDAIVLSRTEEVLRYQLERHSPVKLVLPIRPTDGVDGGPFWGPSTIPDTTLRDHLAVLRGHLDANRLVTSDRLVEAAARLTVSFALEHAVGNAPNTTPYQDLAARYRAQAHMLLRGWRAEFDTDGDGIADLWIS